MQMIPTEEVMDEAISDVGGNRVSSLIGESVGLEFKNADYCCYQHHAILELKCLCTVIETSSYRDKIHKMAYGWMKMGLIPFSPRMKLE